MGSGYFDLVILDPKLPDIDGFFLLRRLSDADRPPKVVVLTTDSRQEAIRRAFREGALAYLIKPLDPDTLLGVIADLLHNKPIRRTDSVWPNLVRL